MKFPQNFKILKLFRPVQKIEILFFLFFFFFRNTIVLKFQS